MAEKKIKILMVEDEADLAEIYGMQMKMSGIDVKIASSGPEALDILRNNKFDLVLLDLFMPEVDGFEVLKKIRADSIIKDNIVYAWSNLTQQRQIDLAKSCGATGFLVKSDYTPKTLVDKIKELLK